MAARHGRLMGVVQGVGFRPYVAGLARELGVAGHVANRGGHVEILIGGPPQHLDRFVARLHTELPAAARIDAESWEPAADESLSRPFEILMSDAVSDGRLAIGPDLRICDACMAEFERAGDRRHGYALNSCTGCGPRLTLVARSPWTRANSALAEFEPCPECVYEYGSASDRRWHAEAIACPRCGPTMWLEDLEGRKLASPEESLTRAAALILKGGILGLRGVGGFQLIVDARSESTLVRLRARKRRPSKAFALMVRDLAAAANIVELDDPARAVLASSVGPIVLLPRAAGASELAPSVAPGQPRLGVMLPTTAAHARLLELVGGPLVVTSGNVHQRPIALSIEEARVELGELADALLVHDRPILRRCDDSVVALVGREVRVLRLARGLAPTRVDLGRGASAATSILALGGHFQQTPALAVGDQALVWPHVGDLDEAAARAAMAASLDDICTLLGREPDIVACDAHPDYATSIWARQARQTPQLERVFHHHAHVAAVLAEHGREHALGVAWDGAGLGEDRSSWGGEFLDVTPAGFRRIAWLEPFPLPGGDAAARDGLRALAGMMSAANMAPDPSDTQPELARLLDIARRPRLSPTCTSAGRMFDGFAAMLGIRRHSEYQGQAASELEHAAAAHGPAQPYPFEYRDTRLDWRPMLRAARAQRHAPGLVAARVHATLIAMILAVARRHRPAVVALSGGCFVNAILLAGASAALAAQGIEVLAPRRLPPGDGGLAVGQAWVVCQRGLERSPQEHPRCA